MKDFSSEVIEKAKKAESVEELCELGDDELDNVAGGACGQGSEDSTCRKCGAGLKRVDYCDGVDPATHHYKLCYGCGRYGLWADSDGWTELPENRVQYLVEKTKGQ